VGYYSKKRVRSERERRVGRLEIALVVLCIAAVATLIVFIITNAGGGHLMF
jgi:cell division protein FtsL